MRGGTAPGPAAIYAIADAEALRPRGLAEGVEAIAQAGIRTIQLRAKRIADRDLFREAEACTRRLEGWEGTLWIDDRVDLAALLSFDGVHLGQSDLPAAEARRLISDRCRIGASTHDVAQWEAARSDDAVDWIALGPILETASKENPDPVVGFEGLASIAARESERFGSPARKPLIAIGGLTADTVSRALESGADSVAFLSAICRGDIAANCRRLLVAAAG